MFEAIQQFDAQILIAINSLHAPYMDNFMMLFTHRFVWIPLYLALTWYFMRRLGWRRGIFCILAISIAVALADQTCATFIRPAVMRLRPSNLNNPISAMIHVVNDYRGGRYGFPSCHGANTFALATFVALLCWRTPLMPLFFGWAILNCYTRMYLGVHYPGDLLVGALIGSAYATIMFFILRKVASVTPLTGTEHVKPVAITAGVLVALIIIFSFIL